MATDVRRREHDYQVTVDGAPAGVAEFRLEDDGDGGRVVFTHTTIDKAFEGQGIGSALAAAALDDVRTQGRRVVPVCPFIRAWIDKHPDYADLVDAA